jgi:DNA primase
VTASAADPRERVVLLKRAHPLPDVLAGYGVALRRAGRALVGLCPLHGDRRTPNLHVYAGPDPALDSWYCFRCQQGGDVLNFLMRHERLSFAAACDLLGGLPPGQDARPRGPAERPTPRWEELTLDQQVVMDAAAALYQRALRDEPRALRYLECRGLPPWLVRARGLGYADGHSLEAYLRRRGGLRVAEELGLLRRPESRDDGRPLREFLAGRVVVPELRGGHAIWFVGRALADDGARAKYLALPGQRPVLGLEQVAGGGAAVLCEGVFDFLTALSWGLPAVSACGTHLTEEQLDALAGAEAVYGVFDGDPAGRAAAARLGERLGARWRPVWLPAGRDLNDLAREAGGEALLHRLLDEADQAGTEDGDAT